MVNYRWLLLFFILLLIVGVVDATTNIYTLDSTTDDGYVSIEGVNHTFAEIIAHPGDTVSTAGHSVYLHTHEDSGYYVALRRSGILINTSSLPDDATITAASFSVKGTDKGNAYTTTPDLCLINISPNTALAAGDYQLGVASPNLIAANLTYTSLSSSNWNTFTLNAAGLAAINKTGKTKIMLLWGWDLEGTPPVWKNASQTIFSFEAGTANMSITYTVPGGTTTTIYPMNAAYINETRILPNSDTNLPPTGLNLSANITPGNYEALSFVIKPDVAVTDYSLSATTLADADGTGHAAIPTSGIDIKIVGVWYQGTPLCNNASYLNNPCVSMSPDPNWELTPELLLNNKSVLSCNNANQNCSVWVQNATYAGYHPVDNTSKAAWPSDWKVYDNATAQGFPQNFSSEMNDNTQVWVTIKSPAGHAAGNYSGEIWVNSSATTPIAMNISIRVLPFTLINATKEYGLFYLSTYHPEFANNPVGTGIFKSRSQMQNDLQDMKNHGILYPTLSQEDDTGLETALSLRDTVGLPHDRIYLIGDSASHDSYIGNGSTVPQLATIASTVVNWKNHTSTYGYTDVYFWGMNELTPTSSPTIQSQRPAWTQVHTSGGKVWASTGTSFNNVTDAVGDLLDSNNVGFYLNTTYVTLYHTTGYEVTSYANPQGAVENPEIYRQNYGFGLWVSGYDGMMNYAYQALVGDTGSVWNEYDSPATSYKDHMLTYPSTNGPIDTIQFEGMREGITDTQYADTLSNITGNTTQAISIINAGIADGVDMSVIRGNMIDAILDAMDDPPVANFTATPTSGAVPLTVQFNDTSIYSPTSWSWYIDANTTPFSTSQNPSWTFAGNQTYTIRLNATNANGFDWENKTAYISGNAITPVAAFSGTPTTGTTSLLVNFTDASTNTPTNWSWYYSNATVGDTLFNITQNPSYNFTEGTYNIRLNATNANGTDWENKTGYIVVSNASTPGTGTTTTGSCTAPIVAALNTIGIMLTVVGLAGIGYSLISIGGFSDKGRSNYGGAGNVNMMLIVGSVLAIMIGAVMLIMSYLIVNAVLGMSLGCT
jgi:PKD repeat protein